MSDGLNEVIHDGFRVGIYLSILSRNMSYIGRRARRYYAIIHDTRTARLCNIMSNPRIELGFPQSVAYDLEVVVDE